MSLRSSSVSAAQRAAETAARTSYGRLVAFLASRTRDIAAAEDALSDAFAVALRVWPERGVPTRPEAWLLTVARRKLGHAQRARGVRVAARAHLELLQGEVGARTPLEFPDERLKLLFVCAHPAIDRSIRTPLMLQVVLGLTVPRIASAFLVAPASMGQRLVRAKAKIRDAGLAFETPERESLPQRIDDVLAAIYAAFGTGWDAIAGADGGVQGLTEEAIYLGRLASTLLPDHPEAKGLLALMLYCDARKAARRDASGAFVPLARQDPALWSSDLVIEAENLLTAAATAGQLGRFQCEAAIQSVHCQRGITGHTNLAALAMLYDLLATHMPTIGVLVSRAAVMIDRGEAAAALEALDLLPAERVLTYQPYWVVRAHASRQLGRHAEADAARDRAQGLTEDPAIRAYLGAIRSP